MNHLIRNRFLFSIPLFGLILTLPYSSMNGIVVICLFFGLIYSFTYWHDLKKIKPLLLAWILFALWYGCSLIWTKYPDLVYQGLRKEIFYPFVGLIFGYLACCQRDTWKSLFFALIMSGFVFCILLILNEHWFFLGGGVNNFIHKQIPGVGDSSTLLILFACAGLLIFKIKRVSLGSFILFLCFESLIFYAILLTKNRMGIVCMALLIVVFMFYLAQRFSKKWKLLFLMLVLPLSIGVIYKGFSTKSSYDGSVAETIIHVSENDSRVWMWKYYLSKAKERPILGYGAGYLSLKKHFDDFPRKFRTHHKSHAHNVFLNKQLQLGLIGVMLFFGMYLVPVLLKEVRSNTDFIYVIPPILLAYIFKSMTDDFFIRNSLIMYWLIIGMLLGVCFNNSTRPAKR